MRTVKLERHQLSAKECQLNSFFTSSAEQSIETVHACFKSIAQALTGKEIQQVFFIF